MSKALSLTLLVLLAVSFCESAAGQFAGGRGPDPKLIKRLRSTDVHERHLAAWEMSRLAELAEEEIIESLAHDDPVVRYWAVRGMGWAISRLRPRQDQLVKRLTKSLTDPSASVKIEAADQLARLGFVEEALPVLIAALDEPQESAAMQAAAALVAMGKQAAPARSKLQQASQSGGEYVKRLATRALQNLEE